MAGSIFNSYSYPNPSSFTACRFNCDATGLGDICFYTNTAGDILPSYYYIAGFGWKSLSIKDNVFDCNTAFPLTVRPYGVYGLMTGMNITSTTSGPGNSFSNLSYGVFSVPFIFGSGGPLTLTNNTFDNNSYGLYASGVAYGLTVKGNHFGVPHYTGYNATGITVAGCIGYYLGYNTFEKSSTTTLPYFGDIGITANNGRANALKIGCSNSH